MTLNELIEKIKNTEMRTVIKCSVIVIAGLLVMREVMVFTIFREVGGTITGVNSWFIKTQDTMEKKFSDQWDKDFQDMDNNRKSKT